MTIQRVQYGFVGLIAVAMPSVAFAACTNATHLPQHLFDSSQDIACNFVLLYNQSLKILLWLIILMIIVAGYVYITSMGNPERTKLAKDVLTTTLIGAALWLALPLILEALGLQ